MSAVLDEAALPRPPRRQLLWSLAGSLLAAALIVVAVVLPAEFHRDPTGFGRVSGLLELSEPRPQAAAAPLHAASGQPSTSAAPLFARGWRSDTIEIAMKPGEELEYKLRLRAGEVLVYSWVVPGGNLYSDFHGEATAVTARGKAQSYLKQDGIGASHGALTAPFTGIHGWYWINVGDAPVVVRLKVSGYYELVPGAPVRLPMAN
jgi:hypothetical protein